MASELLLLRIRLATLKERCPREVSDNAEGHFSSVAAIPSLGPRKRVVLMANLRLLAIFNSSALRGRGYRPLFQPAVHFSE